MNVASILRAKANCLLCEAKALEARLELKECEPTIWNDGTYKPVKSIDTVASAHAHVFVSFELEDGTVARFRLRKGDAESLCRRIQGLISAWIQNAGNVACEQNSEAPAPLGEDKEEVVATLREGVATLKAEPLIDPSLLEFVRDLKEVVDHDVIVNIKKLLSKTS